MSDSPFTIEQAAGFLNAPRREVRRLAVTAVQSLERLDKTLAALVAAEDGLRDKRELRSDYVLVLLHRDGWVEVWAHDWRPIRFAHVNDGPDYEQCVDVAVKKLPRCYAELVLTDAGKVVAFDSTKGCLSSFGAGRADRKLAEIEYVNRTLKEIVAAAAECASPA